MAEPEAEGRPEASFESSLDELEKVVKGESFATAVCGVIDAQQRTLRAVSAGGPPGLAHGRPVRCLGRAL